MREPLRLRGTESYKVLTRLLKADTICAAVIAMIERLNCVVLPETNRAYLKCTWRFFKQREEAAALARKPHAHGFEISFFQYSRLSVGRKRVLIVPSEAPTANSFVLLLYRRMSPFARVCPRMSPPGFVSRRLLARFRYPSRVMFPAPHSLECLAKWLFSSLSEANPFAA